MSMFTYYYKFCLLILLCHLTLYSQTLDFFKTGRPICKTEKNEIPFETRSHIIYVKVQLNNSTKEYNFVIDTGAFTCIDQELAEEVGLQKGNPLVTSGHINSAYMIKDNVSIHLKDIVVENFKIVAMDFSYFKKTDPNINGFLGSNFLRFFNVLIDYNRKHLILSQNSIKQNYSKENNYLKLDLNNHAGLPKVSCQVNNYWQTKALLDTGSPFAITFPISFLDKFSFSEKKHFKESIGIFASWPWTSIKKNYLGRLVAFKIGDIKMQNVPVIFANTEDIILGKEFLSQFRININFPEKYLILTPYGKVNLKDNYISIGLKLNKDETNKTYVEAYWKDSPADRVGIKLNDEIIQINSLETRNLGMNDINRILNNDRIVKIDLVIKKSFRWKRYVLNKEPLLPL